MGKDQRETREKSSDGSSKKTVSGRRDRPDTTGRGSKERKEKQGVQDKQSGSPKSSREYTDKQLKGSAKDNWKKERGGHTRRAEQAARKEIKAATGRDAKVAGKQVEHHHHAGVKESKKVGLSPKVAGEKDRMTGVHSRRDAKVYGTYGEKSDAARNKRYTHHNVASKIDKTEQARTAKAMGAKGDSPKLPRGEAGRKGMVDASGTSKWRWPATADQTERQKVTWARREPVGPKVDAKTGKVIPESTKTPKVEGPPTIPKPKIPGDNLPGGPGKAPGKGGGPDFFGKVGKGMKVLGPVGEVVNSASDVIQLMAKYRPEMLPEGAKVELMKPDFHNEVMLVPSGYTVEKTGGQVIYRDPDGNAATRQDALNSTKREYGGRA